MIHMPGAVDDLMGALHGLGRVTLHPQRPRERDDGRIMQIVGQIDRGAPGARPVLQASLELGAGAIQIAHHVKRSP